MKKAKKVLSKKVDSAITLGKAVREIRKEAGITQSDAAAMCRVGTRFLSDLENGKSTVRLSTLLQVLNSFGLVLTVRRRGWE